MADKSTTYTAAQLLAGLRHDLLSPLNLIMSAGALLQELAEEVEPPLPDDLCNLIEIVVRSGRTALELVKEYPTPDE